MSGTCSHGVKERGIQKQRLPIIENHDVRSGQVDSQASSPSAQEKGKLARTLRVEFLHLRIAFFAVRVSVDPTILVPNETKVVLRRVQRVRMLVGHHKPQFIQIHFGSYLQDIKDACHLAKDQDT